MKKKKLVLSVLSASMLMSLVACTNPATPVAPAETGEQTLTGTAKGYAGPIKVAVTKDGDKIIKVEVLEQNETNGIGTLAIDQLPGAIVEANSTEVDIVATATVTSEAIIYAVNNALDPTTYPAPTDAAEKADPASVTAANVYQGFGIWNTPRFGPGKDDQGVQVYSINQVLANVLFDEDGRILSIHVDQVEVATPNYDGEGMPHFSGFPGQGGYNNDENHDEVVDGKTPDTDENFMLEVQGWVTKRDRGDAYRMGAGSWAEQMDKYQSIFVGKTVQEVEDWFNKYTSDLTGRPLKDGSEKSVESRKYDALTKDEKDMLADVVSSATMSLKDSHGNIIQAIKVAFENKVGLDIEAASSQGLGVVNTPRLGPGKDNTGVGVYSINQVFANTLFDEDGKIVSLYIDQLEVATPNYDGDGMPHFSGFPGQGGFNSDNNHDGVIDGKTLDTDDNFKAELQGWVTKRVRGDAYRMGAGSWAQQMDKYQSLFIGKTVEEVEEWFNNYTSDINGRPLKDGSTNEEDKAKYDALSDEDKAMLADVVSSATMSLNDSHGDIIQAIRASFEKRIDIDLKIK